MTDPVTRSVSRRRRRLLACFRERCSRWPFGPRAEKERFPGLPTPRISSPVRTADDGKAQRLLERTDMQNVLPHVHAAPVLPERGGREQRVFPNTGCAFCPASSFPLNRQPNDEGRVITWNLGICWARLPSSPIWPPRRRDVLPATLTDYKLSGPIFTPSTFQSPHGKRPTDRPRARDMRDLLSKLDVLRLPLLSAIKTSTAK